MKPSQRGKLRAGQRRAAPRKPDTSAEARMVELTLRITALERRLDALTAVLHASARAETPARLASLDLLDHFEYQHLQD